MLVIRSFIIAFGMYSKVPMPRVDWSKENMRYVMCFFPVIGAVIGGALYLWDYVSGVLDVSHVLYTMVIIILPLIITGGIHMDGFMDTTDALRSYQPMEKKLDILKDPNSGAFAVISCVAYYLLTFGFWYDLNKELLPLLAIGFVLSRALSGLSVVTFPLAKNSGLVAMFSNEARKKVTAYVMLAYILVCIVLMTIINPILSTFCFFGLAITYLYYYRMSKKEFGGITGDVAGYFLQLCELVIVIFVVIGGKLCG